MVTNNIEELALQAGEEVVSQAVTAPVADSATTAADTIVEPVTASGSEGQGTNGVPAPPPPSVEKMD